MILRVAHCRHAIWHEQRNGVAHVRLRDFPLLLVVDKLHFTALGRLAGNRHLNMHSASSGVSGDNLSRKFNSGVGLLL